MNGLVARSHCTIMQMIRKLGEDKKADWPGHLAEIVHTYNATWSAMMGYSPHYLMFGCRPRLPVDLFYFPTFRSAEVPKRDTSTKCVGEYMATVHDQLRAQRQKQYYDQKIGTVDLKPGDLVLVKADAFQERWKIKDRWEDKPHGWCIRSWQMSLIWSDRPMQTVMHPTLQPTSPHHVRNGCSPMHGCLPSMGRCTSPTPVKPTPRRRDSETTPWVDSGLAITQDQARRTSLGWINRKLQLLLWTSARVSTEGGWRLQVMCSGSGCLQDHMHLTEG